MKQEHIEIHNQTSEHLPLSVEDLLQLAELIQQQEQRNFIFLEVVFVGDELILELNRTYLGHDYPTDIITFPYHEGENPAEGTLFCCIPQIRRQSQELDVPFETELLRVVIHGMLHLAGYDDTTLPDQNRMRALENKYIKLYQKN